MATQKRNALGRGLDALLSMDDVKTEGSSSISEIELAKITVNPNQPRREFDQTALQELADSIAEIGIIQPITLRKLSDDEYQIIAGERRYRASQKAGLKTIPAYIRTADDENMMEMALIENIQREDLNAVEIALAYQHLLDQYELTQERLSERIGKNRTTIANYLRLLKLPAPIQMALQNKQLDMGHARALISLGDPKLQVKIFEEIQEHGYSVRKSRRDCQIAERRRSCEKRHTENHSETRQTTGRVQLAEATTHGIFQHQGTTDLLRKGERKNQYSFQQRGGTGTYHGNLRYAKKVDDKKKVRNISYSSSPCFSVFYRWQGLMCMHRSL